MDLGYYGYLAQTIPPREIVRALAVRARRALLRGKPFFFEVPHRRRALAPAQRRPALLAHGLSPANAADEILREAQAALGGELRLFGQLKRCGVPIDYHRDPFVAAVRYDPSVPAERVDPFQRGADAKVMWELGRLPQLWRFG